MQLDSICSTLRAKRSTSWRVCLDGDRRFDFTFYIYLWFEIELAFLQVHLNKLLVSKGALVSADFSSTTIGCHSGGCYSFSAVLFANASVASSAVFIDPVGWDFSQDIVVPQIPTMLVGALNIIMYFPQHVGDCMMM